jgi:hypothetical protein
VSTPTAKVQTRVSLFAGSLSSMVTCFHLPSLKIRKVKTPHSREKSTMSPCRRSGFEATHAAAPSSQQFVAWPCLIDPILPLSRRRTGGSAGGAPQLRCSRTSGCPFQHGRRNTISSILYKGLALFALSISSTEKSGSSYLVLVLTHAPMICLPQRCSLT